MIWLRYTDPARYHLSDWGIISERLVDKELHGPRCTAIACWQENCAIHLLLVPDDLFTTSRAQKIFQFLERVH